MNKYILILAVQFFTGHCCQAQSFNVTFLPEKKSIEREFVKYGDYYYLYELGMQGMSGFSANLKRLMHSIMLKKYNNRLEEESQLQLKMPDKGFGPITPILKVIHNKLRLFYFKQVEKDKISLWTALVDSSTLELAAEKEILLIEEEERNIQFYLRSPEERNPERLLVSSPDGSKFLVGWTSGWSKKFFFSVLDKDFTRIRSRIEELADSKTSISNAIVDNNGNAFFSFFYKTKNTGHAEILVNKNAGSEKRLIEIQGGGAAGICLAIDRPGTRLLATGAYKEESDNLVGVYIQSFDINGMKAGPVSKTVFPDDLVTILDKEGWANDKDKKKGLFDEIAFEARMLDNGAMNLTGEFRKETMGVKHTFELSGSILNARFDHMSRNAIFSRVPKIRASAGSTIGDSYCVFDYKDKVFIFYDDHMSNLKQDMSDKPKRSDEYNNSVLAAAIIDEKGVVKREVVIDLSKEDYLGITSSMRETKPGSYFIPFRRIKGMGGLTNDIKWALIDVK